MSSKIYKVYIKTNYLSNDDWSLVGSYKLHSNAVEVRDDYIVLEELIKRRI